MYISNMKLFSLEAILESGNAQNNVDLGLIRTELVTLEAQLLTVYNRIDTFGDDNHIDLVALSSDLAAIDGHVDGLEAQLVSVIAGLSTVDASIAAAVSAIGTLNVSMLANTTTLNAQLGVHTAKFDDLISSVDDVKSSVDLNYAEVQSVDSRITSSNTKLDTALDYTRDIAQGYAVGDSELSTVHSVNQAASTPLLCNTTLGPYSEDRNFTIRLWKTQINVIAFNDYFVDIDWDAGGEVAADYWVNVEALGRKLVAGVPTDWWWSTDSVSLNSENKRRMTYGFERQGDSNLNTLYEMDSHITRKYLKGEGQLAAGDRLKAWASSTTGTAEYLAVWCDFTKRFT
jgi:hypothetical protein